MADVPEYGNFRVAPQGQTGFPIAVPDQAGFDQPIRQLADAARTTMALGGKAAEIALAAQERANRTQVMAATNQAREEAMRLSYDEKDGYIQVKGRNVLPQGGKPLAVDYAERYDTHLSGLRDGLANDEQRRMFDEQVNPVRAGFVENVQQHEMREWDGFELSTAEGSRQLSIKAISANRNNPAAMTNEIANLDLSVATIGNLKGLSAPQIEAMQAENRSAAVESAIGVALEEGDVSGAQRIFDQFGDKMSDVAKATTYGKLRKETVGRDIMSIADVAVSGQTDIPAIGGSAGNTGYDPKGLKALIRAPESNGDDRARNKAGSSASGRYQFVEGTFKALYSRVYGGDADEAWRTKRFDPGVQEKLMDQLLQDNERTLRANNLPVNNGNMYVLHVLGAKDGARVLTAKGDTPVATLLSSEIVQKNPTYFGKKGMTVAQSLGVIRGKVGDSGGGGTSTPGGTLEGAWRVARAEFLTKYPDASPVELQQLRGEVVANWNMREDAKAQADEEAVKAAQEGLLKNGGSWSKLPPSVRNAVPADKVPQVMAFGESVSSANKPEPDVAFYGQLVGDPQRLYGMADSEFNALRPRLGDQAWLSLARERGNYKMAAGGAAAKARADASALPRESLNRVVNGRLSSLGLPTDPKADDPLAPQVYATRAFVDRAVLDEQMARGNPFTDGELTQFVDRLFAVSVPTSTKSWTGFTTERANDPMFSLGAKHLREETRAAIVDEYARQGITNPSEAQIMEAYYYKQYLERRRGGRF